MPSLKQRRGCSSSSLANPFASRWSGLAAALLTEIAAGQSYLYSVWSPVLRQNLNLSVGDMNTVNTLGSLGGYLTFVAGALYDAYGPLPTMLLAASLSACGASLMAGVASQELPTSAALLAFSYMVVQHANSVGDIAAVAANVSNFPSERGLVVGLIKAAFGISAGILTIFYQTWFNDNVAGLWRFLSIFTPVVFFLAAFFHKLEKNGEGNAATKPAEKTKLLFTFGATVLVAIWITTTSALKNFNKISDITPFGFATIGLTALFLIPGLPTRLFNRCTIGGLQQQLSGVASENTAGGAGGASSKATARLSKPLLTHPTLLETVGQQSSDLHVPLLIEDPSGAATAIHASINSNNSNAKHGAQRTADFDGDRSMLNDSGAVVASPGMFMPASPVRDDDAASIGTGAGAVPAQSNARIGAGGGGGAPFLSPQSAYTTDTATGQVTSERARRRQQTERAIREANKKKITGAATLEALCTLDFWLLFYVTFAITGSGLVMISNLGNLSQSLGAGDGGQDLDVTLLSVFNCIGRLLFGFLSDLTSRSISKPAWLAVGAACMTGAMITAAFSNLNVLYFASLSTGFAYGSIWALGPPMFADRFGGKSFATIYALGGLSSALASFLLNAQLATKLYNAHTPPGATTCIGTDCYRWTFIILCILSGVAVLFSLLLSYRLRPLYTGHQGKAVAYEVFISATGHGCGVRLAHRLCGPCCGRCKAGRGLLGVDSEGRPERDDHTQGEDDSDDDDDYGGSSNNNQGRRLLDEEDDGDEDGHPRKTVKEKSVFRSLTFHDADNGRAGGGGGRRTGPGAVRSAKIVSGPVSGSNALNDTTAAIVGGQEVDSMLDAPDNAIFNANSSATDASDRSHFGSTAIAIPHQHQQQQQQQQQRSGPLASPSIAGTLAGSASSFKTSDASVIGGSANGSSSSSLMGTSVVLKIGSLVPHQGVNAPSAAAGMSRSYGSSARLAQALLQQQQQQQQPGTAGTTGGTGGTGEGLAMSSLNKMTSVSSSNSLISPPSSSEIMIRSPPSSLPASSPLAAAAATAAGMGGAAAPVPTAPLPSSLSHPLAKAKAKAEGKKAKKRQQAALTSGGGGLTNTSAGAGSGKLGDDSFYNSEELAR